MHRRPLSLALVILAILALSSCDGLTGGDSSRQTVNRTYKLAEAASSQGGAAPADDTTDTTAAVRTIPVLYQPDATGKYLVSKELTTLSLRDQTLDVKLVEEPYDPQEFYTAVQGLEQEPEKGSRCTVCYRLRMERAAQYAKAHGFVWFTTTLSVSPLKDPIRINQIGEELAARYGLRHLPSEFKKRDGYKRSLELSREYGLYRQDYCGCEFSARARGKA